MPNVLIHKASELRPETRAAVEAELGRSLQDGEEVSIMAFVTPPTGQARAEAARALRQRLRHVAYIATRTVATYAPHAAQTLRLRRGDTMYPSNPA
jgi:hypothetical protein